MTGFFYRAEDLNILSQVSFLATNNNNFKKERTKKTPKNTACLTTKVIISKLVVRVYILLEAPYGVYIMLSYKFSILERLKELFSETG